MSFDDNTELVMVQTSVEMGATVAPALTEDVLPCVTAERQERKGRTDIKMTELDRVARVLRIQDLIQLNEMFLMSMR